MKITIIGKDGSIRTGEGTITALPALKGLHNPLDDYPLRRDEGGYLIDPALTRARLDKAMQGGPKVG